MFLLETQAVMQRGLCVSVSIHPAGSKFQRPAVCDCLVLLSSTRYGSGGERACAASEQASAVGERGGERASAVDGLQLRIMASRVGENSLFGRETRNATHLYKPKGILARSTHTASLPRQTKGSNHATLRGVAKLKRLKFERSML